MQTVLITGAAGFIGFHVAKRFIKENFFVIGIDNLNPYYEVSLKEERIKNIKREFNNNLSNWKFFERDLNEEKELNLIFEKYKPNFVIHLAAQAGVRYSLKNPKEYINSNITGFFNIIELCKIHHIKCLLYASSSSVYGGNAKLPFSEKDSVNHPISLYAATKRSNELIAHSYSHLYDLPCIGLRFFTVYGPWGRPDMAPMIFAKAIYEQQPIEIYNKGDMKRDFTYIDDIVETISRLIFKVPNKNKDFDKFNPDPSSSWAPHIILNIGNNKPIKLLNFIETLEKEIGLKAIKTFKKIQLGDVKSTLADTNSIEKIINFKPNTSIEDGIKNFINWYKEFYCIRN